MKAFVILRLGSVGALAALLAGCGMAEADPHRFEGVAKNIAAIPLSAKPEARHEPAGPRNAEEAGLRPLKVELLTPHQLWDARDGLTAKAAAVLPAMPAVFHDPEAPAEVQAAQRAEVQPSRPVPDALDRAKGVSRQRNLKPRLWTTPPLRPARTTDRTPPPWRKAPKPEPIRREPSTAPVADR